MGARGNTSYTSQASMRPRHKAAENFLCFDIKPFLERGFNEAAA